MLKLNTVLRSSFTSTPSYAYHEFCLTGKEMEKKGRHEEALQWYNNALVVKPDYYPAYFYKAITYKSLKRRDLELECYNRALAIKADFYQALYNKAIALEALGKSDDAIGAFIKAARSKPEQDCQLLLTY